MCYYLSIKMLTKGRQVTKCKQCGIDFETWACNLKMGRAKYCSRECYYKANTGKEHWHWQGGKLTSICVACGKEFQYYFDKRRGERKLCSKDCLNKWQETSLRGKNNPNWKNGISTETNCIRTSKRYEDWKDTVFKRDDYTCQLCGIRGGDLNAHHILSFKGFPKYRLEVDNGITYCVECHEILTTTLSWGCVSQPLPHLSV